MKKIAKQPRAFKPLHNKRGERIGYIHPDYSATVTVCAPEKTKATNGRSKKIRR